MTGPSGLDPELAVALAAVPRGSGGVFDISDIPATREAVRAFAEQIAAQVPDDPSVSVEEHIAQPGDGGSDVVLRLLRPAADGVLPALLWFHGGGQVLGYAAQDDAYLKPLCSAVGCVVIAVEYRLAPEAPAPAAAEDGYTAYRWVREQAEQLGVDSSRIGLAGASGGGGIAAAAALMIRDRGLPTPLFQALNYPMLDDRNETDSSREITDIGIWDRHNNVLAWRAILGDRAGTDDVPAYSVPGRTDSLGGLPPTFIAVGDHDVFRDEDLAYAQRLQRDGVPVELHLYPGAYHAFDLFAPTSALAASFTSSWYAYLRRLFTAPSPPR